MPILGATAPVTPAGAAVVAAAEILGCMTAATLVDPEVYCFSTSIAGEMDMRTTQVCYSTPAAILTDAILHQLFRERYGLVHNVEPAYVEAKVPGIQAATMKVFRHMALGAAASLSLGIGTLDNAAVFSPTQAMIDLETNEAIYRFFRGAEVSVETLALDLIQELEFCGRRTYLDSEHTLRHFREVGWNPRLFDRSYCDHTAPAPAGDERMLDKADRAWRELVAAARPPDIGPGLVREIDRIVAAARSELLA